MPSGLMPRLKPRYRVRLSPDVLWPYTRGKEIHVNMLPVPIVVVRVVPVVYWRTTGSTVVLFRYMVWYSTGTCTILYRTNVPPAKSTTTVVPVVHTPSMASYRFEEEIMITSRKYPRQECYHL